MGFYPNNLVQVQPAEAQGISCAAVPRHLYKVQSHGFCNGDIVLMPTKRTRRMKSEEFPQEPEKWVVVDASEMDEIAITRYSAGFEGLEDFTRGDSLTWSYRRPHEVHSTGDDIFSYREKVQAVAEAMRQQHDLALTPTSHRYVENLDLDNLLATAIQYFESKGYQANFAGYLSSEGSWQICIFHKNGDLVGSLLIDALPNFDDPNQNCPWLGGYKDLYWRPDEELEDEIYERDLVSDLEKLTAPLEVSEPKPDPELEKFQQLESFLDEVFLMFQKAGYGSDRVGKSLEILSKEGDDLGLFLCTLAPSDIPESIPNERIGKCRDWYWWLDADLELSLCALENEDYSARNKIIAALVNISQELEKEWQSLEPDPFQHDAWLDDKPGIDNNDRDPFEGKVSEGFGLFALT